MWENKARRFDLLRILHVAQSAQTTLADPPGIRFGRQGPRSTFGDGANFRTRYLAVRTAQRRARVRSESLIIALINHSLGAGAARTAQLERQAAMRWLGDVNLKESVARSVAPTPQVDDAFRTTPHLAPPTLLLAGDYDWSTPIENAEALMDSLTAGNLVRVHGGRHCTETNVGELSAQAPEVTLRLYAFIDADLGGAAGRAFRESLPRSVALAPINFALLTKRSLYDEWLERR